MILKMATHTEGSWRYVEMVAQLHVEDMDPVKYLKNYNGAGRSHDGVWLRHYKELNGGLKQINENFIGSLKEITVYLYGDTSLNYITDQPVYLMSDEGKTIERIN